MGRVTATTGRRARNRAYSSAGSSGAAALGKGKRSSAFSVIMAIPSLERGSPPDGNMPRVHRPKQRTDRIVSGAVPTVRYGAECGGQSAR
ncbi:hypothetical protein GCM10017688_44280 [Streptomyces ramulosus]